MPHTLRKYFLLIFVMKLSWSSGQQFYFKNYSTENGLPFVQVYCLIQDSKGYLWSGGYGGLSRFDGKEFLNFSQKNGLSNHYVNTICEGDSAKIYVGTENGLNVLKENRVIAGFDVKSGLADKKILSLCYLGENGMLIGTKKGLCHLRGKNLNVVKNLNSLEIKCMILLGNTVWIGTNKGLFTYNHFKGTVAKRQGLDGDDITCLEACEGENKVLVGSTNGFSIIDETAKKVSNYHMANGLIDEHIKTIKCQGPNSIWVGSGSGLLNFNGKEFRFYNVYNENNSNHIRCIISDTEKNIWLGTHTGLYRYRDNAFSTFKEGSIANAVVFQIFRDSKNDLWLCSENGVFKYSQGFFKRYSTEDGLNDNVVNAAFEDNDGTIWFCTGKGITWYRNGIFREFSPPGGFQLQGPLTAVYKDKKGTIWVGAKNGAAGFKKVNGTYIPTYYPIATLTQEWGVTAFIEDKDGGLWMGTFLGGMFKFENNAFIYKSKQLNIEPESFFMLTCDKYNVIYGATLNGLWVYDLDNNKQQLITEKEGLNSEFLYSIRLDHSQNELWIGTNQGINKLDLDKLRTSNTIDIVSYGKSEGFLGGETNSYGIWQDPDSTWWHGTVTGVVRYEPDAFKKNDQPNKTYIYSVKLQNQDTVLQSGSLFPYNYNNSSFSFLRMF